MYVYFNFLNSNDLFFLYTNKNYNISLDQNQEKILN